MKPAEPPQSLRGTSGRARLSDVAKLAGVSLGSASRALNSPESVKPKTRAAVQAAIEQLAYVPHGLARSLVLGRSFMISAIVPTVDNPVYADFLHALQKRLEADHYHLMISAHEYSPEAEVSVVQGLLQRGVDGVVLVGTDHDPRVLALLARSGAPFLFTWSTDEAEGRACVGCSNRGGMRGLAGHLIDLGHRDIAILSGPTEHNERARAKIDGLADALAEAGLPASRILYGPFTVEAGKEGMRAAMALRQRPTAVIGSTDIVAAGALAEAKAMGLRVPQDVSIAGFDDIELASLVTPSLTTVRVPTAQMGRGAGDAILRAIAGAPVQAAVLETALVIRESTGPAPH